MKVILKKDILGVGKKNEICDVSDGYAKNFLIPKNLAVACGLGMENLREEIEKKKEMEKKSQMKLKESIEAITLDFFMKSHNGKLYGAVHALDISASLENLYKLKIDKNNILLKKPIKEYGLFLVPIKLSSYLQCELKVKVF
jgi:large subunit ribosomal protein L9